MCPFPTEQSEDEFDIFGGSESDDEFELMAESKNYESTKTKLKSREKTVNPVPNSSQLPSLLTESIESKLTAGIKSDFLKTNENTLNSQAKNATAK